MDHHPPPPPHHHHHHHYHHHSVCMHHLIHATLRCCFACLSSSPSASSHSIHDPHSTPHHHPYKHQCPAFFFLSFLMPTLTLKSLTESHSCHTPDHDMIRLSSLQCHCTYHCHCHCHCHCGDCQAEQTQRNLTGRCKRSRTTLY